MYLAEAARNYDGTDLYNYTSPDGGSLKKAIAGMVSLAYPIERTGVRGGSVRMATLGDGSTAPPNRINAEAGDAYFVNKPNVFPERHAAPSRHVERPPDQHQPILDDPKRG